MSNQSLKEAAEFIYQNLRLRTFPVAVKFLKNASEFPEKTRQPSSFLGKKVAICQAVTMARLYGWMLGITKADLICVPGALAFGFAETTDPDAAIVRLFCTGNYSKNEEAAGRDASAIGKLPKGAYGALVIAPLARSSFEPDTIVIYGNPAQVMRAIQAWVYQDGRRIQGNFGGKVECAEYLLVPFKEGVPRVVVPGMGDRVFSLTQDDEMVFSLPGKGLGVFLEGMKEAGSKVGAQYPVPFFLNFEPQFPKPFLAIGKEVGLF
ncbi:MAG TPA: DUF169 domain-containing protein [Syntrophales bacterium]|nr:DUF169 domain-containing protein [Syntrophales bacterium]HPN23695.1 DUF169 domain-containing protein [Syntrophales bacterium]